VLAGGPHAARPVQVERVLQAPPHRWVPTPGEPHPTPAICPLRTLPGPKGQAWTCFAKTSLVGLARDVETEGGICRAGPPSRTSSRPVREVWILEGHPEHCDGQDWNEVAFQGRFPRVFGVRGEHDAPRPKMQAAPLPTPRILLIFYGPAETHPHWTDRAPGCRPQMPR